MPAAPRISVVIVNWNTRQLLSNCLSSLRPDMNTGLCEVIVVDNGSADGSPDMVERDFPAVRLVRNPTNRGFTAATNQGFEVSRGEYVLMLNSDTEVGEHALRDSAAHLDSHADVAIVGCRLTYPDGRPQNSCFREPSLRAIVYRSIYLEQLFPRSPVFNFDRYGLSPFAETREVECVMGSYMLIRRSALEPGPLLDEGYFMYAEEADLCHRVRAAGWKVVFHPGSVVAHHHAASSGADPTVAAWSYGARQRALLRFLHKWRGPFVAWLANLVVLIGLIPRSLAWLAQDAAAAVREGRAPTANELVKARSAGFHLAAMLRPALFDASWAPSWVEPRPTENPVVGATAESIHH